MRTWKLLLGMLGLTAFPLAALAVDTISPLGHNAWDLYVYGNGPAISAILSAIKLMIAPTSGNSSFQILLLFLATAGFLAMAVKAGFEPAKNFTKMFFFVLIVWMVTYLTRGAQSNVNVMDPVTNYANVVEGVPALVAVPASIISQVGYFLTLQIEQNFQLPNGADPAGLNISSGAEYNLFAKMLGDSKQYAIQDPDLKRSLSAYMADCVVAAVGRGAMSVSSLLDSPNLLNDLQAATNQAIMTRYYLTEMQTAQAAGALPSNFTGPTCGGATASSLGNAGFNTTSPGLGVLVSCQQAYTCLAADMPTMAKNLETASAAQWQATGVTVPFDTAMSSALALASAGGSANTQAAYASPESFILQKAMVSSATGAFRQAATNSGNNEIMLATSLAQAEQSQKTSWVTATEIFKNMMGYVYTVLQAFIFAMVPIVVICLMIPGMGGAIFLNYVQILVWLTLWTPMLAIVNFLIEIFGSSQLGSSLGTDGLTMGNSALVSEQANNMQIVAEFMGTLVPLMTWGLVKGAMAFTEFISHGIGSAFATQAGAQAATGNVSMGNASLDNTTMNKYSTMHSVGIGYDAVQGGLSAGAAVTTHESGLEKETSGGTSTNATIAQSKQISLDDSHGVGHLYSTADALNMQAGNTRVANEAANLNETWSTAKQKADTLSAMWASGIKAGSSQKAGVNDSTSNAQQALTQYTVDTKGGMSLEGLASLGVNYDSSHKKAYTAAQDMKQTVDKAWDIAMSSDEGRNYLESHQGVNGRSTTGGSQLSAGKADSVTNALTKTRNDAISDNDKIDHAMKVSTTMSQTEVANSDQRVDVGQRQGQSDYDASKQAYVQAGRANTEKLSQDEHKLGAAVHSSIHSVEGRTDAGVTALQVKAAQERVEGPVDGGDIVRAANAAQAGSKTAIASGKDAITNAGEAIYDPDPSVVMFNPAQQWASDHYSSEAPAPTLEQAGARRLAVK